VLVSITIATFQLLCKCVQRIGNAIDALKPKLFILLHEVYRELIGLTLMAKQSQMRVEQATNQQENQELEVRSFLYTQVPVCIIETVTILAVVMTFVYYSLFTYNNKNTIILIGFFATQVYRLLRSINRITNMIIIRRQIIVDIETSEQFWSCAEASEQVAKEAQLAFSRAITLNYSAFFFTKLENL